MRKKEALALIIALALGMTAGCAPGDISRYAKKAQQAGEEIFEGKTVPAAADAADVENAQETEAEGIAESGHTEEAADALAERGTKEPEAAAETEGLSGTEAAYESKAASESGDLSQTKGASTGSEAALEATETAGTETAAESEGAVGSKSAGKAEDDGSGDSAAAQETLQIPAMMTAVEDRVQSALAEKADWVSGSLAGRDTLTRAQQNAMQAVLRQEAYGDKTLCLISSGQYEGQQAGSFLLFCDSTALTARGRVNGDLWYYDGKTAARILKNTEFMQQKSIRCGGRSYLLVQTLTEEKTQAQVYCVKDGRAAGCFQDAVSVEQEGEKLRVNYKSDHIEYDPMSAKWSGNGAEITYFYVPGEDGFEQENVRELTAEQYLAYIQPEEGDTETQRLKEELEARLYHDDAENVEYRYSFFAIGDDRIGYRECRIGLPEDSAEKNSHVVAKYIYHIAKLENGRRTAQCETLSGSGYYFAQWDQKEEELEGLSALPVMYLKNRIDRAGQTLRTRERAALARVQELQEYDADSLCFVEQRDYDGDGGTESFVAVGRYDGVLCVPVCDLWFVSGGNPVLISEKLPVKSMFSFEEEGISLLLLDGFETDGASARLYGVRDGAAQRLLPDASEIEVEENGDLTAKIAGTNGELPYYYHILNGTVTEYGVQEKAPEMLFDYENGKAVYRQLKRLAQLQDATLSCLKRDNGLIHVMLTGQNGVSYETYRVSDGALVLTDCGDGGYEAGADADAVKAEAPVTKGAETEMPETETVE